MLGNQKGTIPIGGGMIKSAWQRRMATKKILGAGSLVGNIIVPAYMISRWWLAMGGRISKLCGPQVMVRLGNQKRVTIHSGVGRIKDGWQRLPAPKKILGAGSLVGNITVLTYNLIGNPIGMVLHMLAQWRLTRGGKISKLPGLRVMAGLADQKGEAIHSGGNMIKADWREWMKPENHSVVC